MPRLEVWIALRPLQGLALAVEVVVHAERPNTAPATDIGSKARDGSAAHHQPSVQSALRLGEPRCGQEQAADEENKASGYGGRDIGQVVEFRVGREICDSHRLPVEQGIEDPGRYSPADSNRISGLCRETVADAIVRVPTVKNSRITGMYGRGGPRTFRFEDAPLGRGRKPPEVLVGERSEDSQRDCPYDDNRLSASGQRDPAGNGTAEFRLDQVGDAVSPDILREFVFLYRIGLVRVESSSQCKRAQRDQPNASP